MAKIQGYLATTMDKIQGCLTSKLDKIQGIRLHSCVSLIFETTEL